MDRFESIVGYGAIKLELARILDQLTNPEKYAELGVTEPRGLLLHGAPGVGKSTMAECVVKASGRAAFICRKNKSNGHFVDEIVRIFDEAAAAAPSVVLLDDLDKFANEDERHCDSEEFVTVQACIDKVKGKRVFVVATANNMRKLPPSLTRPGRFDHILRFDCPSGKDAEDIVAYYLSRKQYVSDLDVKRIARLLDGHSCAQLEAVVNQAGAYAAFDGRRSVEMKDMVKAILRIVFEAPESFSEDPSTLPLTACHEAGHALVAELLQPDSVNLVTVLNHDSYAAGITSLNRDEGYFHYKEMMENRVICLLGGKAAVELCYGVVDPGANEDLKRAFSIVHRFVDDYCSFGFGQYVFTEMPSGGVLDRRDTRVAAEMENYYARAKKLIADNRGKLDRLISRLIEEKTLMGSEVQQIIASA